MLFKTPVWLQCGEWMTGMRRGEECLWLGNRSVEGKGTELSKDGIAGALS